MKSVGSLSTVVLLLGVASVARASPALENAAALDEDALLHENAVSIDGPEGQAKADNADMQERLLRLEEELRRLRKEQAELSREVEWNFLARSILSAVKREDFRTAEKKLSQLGDTVSIADIVHEAYSDCECNFGFLVNLSLNLTNVETSYKILSALNDEMKKNGRKDVGELVTLLKAFLSTIPQLPKSTQNDECPALVITITGLAEEITAEASNVLSTAMKSEENYACSAKVAATSRAIGDWSSYQTSAVMNRTVEKAFRTVIHERILEAINSHDNLFQRISGMDALYEQLKAAGPLKGTIVGKLASRLRPLKDHSEVGELVRKLYDKFPTCVRNLFTQREVCFYNKLRDSYLVASPSSFYDGERRNVFTVPRSADGSLPQGSKWRVGTVKDQLYFESSSFPGENIYGALFNYDNATHYVFTWLPGWNTDDQSVWNLELDGDKCYLRNVHAGEYLFASDTVHLLTGNRYVFTTTKQNASSELPFIWEITDCSPPEAP